MVSEEDVWRTAFIIADQYGPEGVDFAARMAQSFEIGGKMEEHRAWASITAKVATLTAEDGGFARPN